MTITVKRAGSRRLERRCEGCGGIYDPLAHGPCPWCWHLPAGEAAEAAAHKPMDD